MAVNNFIPEVWSKKILLDLNKKLVALGLTNSNYQGEIANQGDTVNIVSPADVTVSDYTGADFDWSDVSDTVQQLVIDQAKFFNFQIKDIDQAKSISNLIQIYSQNATDRLAEAIDADILKVMGAGAHADNTIDTIAITKSNIYDTIVEAGKMLSLKNVPREGRFLVLSPYEMEALTKSEVALRDTPIGDQAIKSGWMGRVGGFDIFESNNVNVDVAAEVADGEPVLRYLPFGHRVATTFAQQISKVERTRREKNFGDGVKGLAVYGRKVIYPKALGVIKVDSGENGTLV